jgi:adenosylhomocysteine nucleosidase
VVAIAGVGQRPARRAADWLLARPARPGVLIAAGFAGALQPDLPPGSVVVPSEVADGQGGSWPAAWPVGEVPWARGRVLTCPGLITSPQEKQALGVRNNAVAVDMESAAVARACAERGVAFGCVRAVSDDWATPLAPALVRVLSGGRVSPGRLALALLGRPALGGELLRLAWDTRQAARNLAGALVALLEQDRAEVGA